MPDRIVRDELLDSDRYLGLSSDTVRIVFVHFLLVADDLGNAEATGPFIRRRILPGAQLPDEAIAKIVAELADADLIRIYQVGHKRYAHIPRFRQRLRSFKRINPRPPPSVECAEIKDIADKLTDKSPTDARQKSDNCQSLAGEVKRSEEKRREGKERARGKAVDNLTTNQAINPQVKTVLRNLTQQPERPKPRSRHEQLTYVEAMTKGKT